VSVAVPTGPCGSERSYYFGTDVSELRPKRFRPRPRVSLGGVSPRQGRRLLQRALELTTSVGFERLSIGDLAADLGLSKSGLFAHFGSKEQLQLDVLDAAAESFKAAVFDPVPRGTAGDARVVALFDNILEWIQSREMPGGCIFMAGAFEWDDAQGPVRQRLVEWHEKFKLGIVRSVSIAVEQRLFRADLDAELFAHELHGILLEYHLEARLMRNKKALSFARRAFQRLLVDARG
jgi:AcrR family transcriptional regulator